MAKKIILFISVLLTVLSIVGYGVINQKITIGEAKLAAGQAQYDRGQAMLNSGKKRLASGEQQLHTAKTVYHGVGGLLGDVLKSTPVAAVAYSETGKKIKQGDSQVASGRAQVKAGQAKLAAGKIALTEGRQLLSTAKMIRSGLLFGAIGFGIISLLLSLNIFLRK